jgi:hypothetical protein
MFAFLQYLFRIVIKPRTHVMIDLLMMQKRKGILGLYDGQKMKLFAAAVDLGIVWGATDPESFSRAFNVPQRKFRFHHYHTTRENFKFTVRHDNYIFAGGNSVRDYATFIEAVKTIDHAVFIATNLPGVEAMARPWKHITVKGLPGDEFYQKMAGCRILVECHLPGSLRTVGHQTILNAMWMGKPIVLADRNSARGYIVDGEDGLVVEAGDSEGVRNCILRLLNEPELESSISQHALKKVRDPQYSIPHTMQSIYNIAIKMHCDKRGIDPSAKYVKAV